MNLPDLSFLSGKLAIAKALKSYGWVLGGGLCDYGVSSLALAKNLTVFNF